MYSLKKEVKTMAVLSKPANFAAILDPSKKADFLKKVNSVAFSKAIGRASLHNKMVEKVTTKNTDQS